jgi:opacity protein-like surface antigen
MRSTQSFFRTILFTGLAAITGAVSQGQTSVAASLYGAFSPSTSGNGTTQSPSNAAGALLELRHIRNPLVGYEFTYAYNRGNQAYSENLPSGCGLVCAQTGSASIPANAHQISADWVVSLKAANLRPFVLAGGGVLLNVPGAGTVTAVTCPVEGLTPCTTSSVPTSISAKGVFVYGAGLDWTLLPHLGLRLQYRGNLYKASALANAFSSTNAFTHSAEPMIGVFFRL